MNTTIVRLAAQALLGRRRFWLLLLMPLVLVALAVVVRLLTGDDTGYEEIVVGLGLGLVLPLVAGILDMLGNVMFILAERSGRLDIAAVTGAFYPAVTVILAWIILKEHMKRAHLAGVLTALLAIVLISIG